MKERHVSGVFLMGWMGVLSLSLTLGLLSCDNSGKQENYVVLADRARLLEDDPLFKSVDVKDGLLTFTFLDDAAKLDLREGDIFIGKTNGGYLRKALSITLKGNTAEIKTEEAALTDAIVEGHISMSLTPKNLNQKGPDNQLRTKDVDISVKPRFDFGGWTAGLSQGFSTTAPTAGGGGNSLNGTSGSNPIPGLSAGIGESLTFKDPSYLQLGPTIKMDIDIGTKWGFIPTVKKFYLEVAGELDTNVDVTMSVSGNISETLEKSLGEGLEFDYGCFMIGPVPVCVSLGLTMAAGITFSVGGAFAASWGFDCKGEVRGITHFEDGKWDNKRVGPKIDCNGHEFKVDGASGYASVRTYLKPQAQLKFYKVAGPYLNFQPYLALAVKTPKQCKIPWDLTSGLGVNIGVGLSQNISKHLNFNAGINFGFTPWSKVLKEGTLATVGTCDPDQPPAPEPLAGCTDQDARKRDECLKLLDGSCMKQALPATCALEKACGQCSFGVIDDKGTMEVTWGSGLKERLSCSESGQFDTTCNVVYTDKGAECLKYTATMHNTTVDYVILGKTYRFEQIDPLNYQLTCPDGKKEKYTKQDLDRCSVLSSVNVQDQGCKIIVPD